MEMYVLYVKQIIIHFKCQIWKLLNINNRSVSKTNKKMAKSENIL